MSGHPLINQECFLVKKKMMIPKKNGKGPQYAIELVYIGKNKEKIVELLSKIKGLTRPSQELVDMVPCIVAWGARQNDAKNFQVVMQKLGAEVRLVTQ